jgi:aryl-alcohol dehydrogenase-like predicted oxidoreductase
MSTCTRSTAWTTRPPLEETLEALHDVVKAGKARYLGASSMHAWEFAKALHLQREHGWARFVSMQDHYNLLAREEEREMLPLCADEGVGTIVWSPLARGRLTRDPEPGRQAVTKRPVRRPAVHAGGQRSRDHRRRRVGRRGPRGQPGPGRAGLAAANPVVVAPLVGASKTSHIDDAVASLEIELTGDEIARLERPYTPRYDFQGISDDAELARISARIGIKPAGA